QTDVVIDGGSEGTVWLAQEHGDVVVGVRGKGDVGLAIAVEVRRYDAAGGRGGLKRLAVRVVAARHERGRAVRGAGVGVLRVVGAKAVAADGHAVDRAVVGVLMQVVAVAVAAEADVDAQFRVGAARRRLDVTEVRAAGQGDAAARRAGDRTRHYGV